jgi:uncharacterized protein (TIGR03067 family)
MAETFIDPETGWIVTRETVISSGVELVWECLTDPATGVVLDGGLVSPQFPRDLRAWVRGFTAEPLRTDHQLFFWKLAPGVPSDPRAVYRRLMKGERLAELDDLPGDRIKGRIVEVFAHGWYQRGELYWEGPEGLCGIQIGPQHFAVESSGLPTEVLQRLMDIAADFGCNAFDRQAGEPSELRRLQGLWQRLLGGMLHRNGRQVIIGPVPDGPCFFVCENRLIWLDQEGKPSGQEFEIKLEVTAEPKRITLTPRGHWHPWPINGIYSVTGDSLRIHVGVGLGRNVAPRQFLELNNPIEGVDGVEWLAVRNSYKGSDPPGRTVRCN